VVVVIACVCVEGAERRSSGATAIVGERLVYPDTPAVHGSL
jgi:hypothetical protein